MLLYQQKSSKHVTIKPSGNWFSLQISSQISVQILLYLEIVVKLIGGSYRIQPGNFNEQLVCTSKFEVRESKLVLHVNVLANQ